MTEYVLVDSQGMPLTIEKEKKTPTRGMIEEISKGGVTYWNGFIRNDEFNDNLTGFTGTATYDRMRRTDAQVQGVLFAIMLPVLSANWDVVRPDNEAEAKKITDEHIQFAKRMFFNQINWTATLRHALSSLWAGFSWFEKVYAIEDGQIVLKKLSPRLPTTLYRWWSDNTDRVIGITQRIQSAPHNQDIDLPIDKILLFSYQKEGNNAEGQSILRGAYKSWFIKDQLYRIDAIRHERYAIGVPHITMPENWDSNTLAEAKKIGTNWRGAEQSALVTPPGWQIEIVQMTSSTTDILQTIQHHNEEIAKAMLAQFMNFGTTQSGSRALAEISTSFFYDAEIGLADWIADGLNRDVLWPLLDLNFQGEPRPLIKANNIGAMALSELMDSLAKIPDYLPPDFELENHIRKLLRLPPKERPTTPPVQVGVAPPVPQPGGVKPKAKVGKKTVEQGVAEQDTEDAGEGEQESTKAHEHYHSYELRDLRPSEHCLSLADIESKFFTAKNRMLQKIYVVRDGWLDKLGGQLKSSKSLAQVSQINLMASDERLMANRIEAVLNELYNYGKMTVRQELHKQNGQLQLADLDQPGIEKVMKSRARIMAKKLMSRVISATQEAGVNLYRTDGFGGKDDFFGPVMENLYASSEKDAKNLVGYNISESFNMGRHAAAVDLGEFISVAEYSAVLDQALCPKCRAHDGEQVKLDSDIYRKLTPPLHNCDGRNRCRCMWVYIAKTEMGQ